MNIDDNVVKSPISLENFIINYTEENNNISMEIGKQQGNDMIITHKIELINIKKIYIREYNLQFNKSPKENIKEINDIPYKEISSLKEEIAKNNIILHTNISRINENTYSMDIFMDWDNKEYRIIFQDYKLEIIKNISIY